MAQVQKLQARPWTVDEISKVTHVQNVSGGILYLHDLSESGDEGKGFTLRTDAQLEIKSVVSDKAKMRSQALRRGLEGVPAGSGFHEQAPTLMAISGPADKKLVKTVTVGSTLSKTAPVPAEENEYDVLLMEQDLKDMEGEVDTEKNPVRRAQLMASIVFQRAEIDKKRATVKTGAEAGVVQTLQNPEAPKEL